MKSCDKLRLLALTASLVIASGPLSAAVIQHTPDANTLLLYHLNETTPNQYPDGADFADSNFTGSPGPFDGFGFDIASDQIVMGQASLPGLGNSVRMLGPTASKRNAISAGSAFSGGNYWNGGSLTLEAWIMNPLLTGADSTTGRVIAMSRNSSISFSYGLTTTGAMKAYGNVTGGSFNISTSGLTWEIDTWYYVALVVDTTGQEAGMAEYNFYRAAYGTESLSLLHTAIGQAPGDADSGLTIGGETSANARTFQGYMDEVHFSNIARSEDYLSSYGVIPEPSTSLLVCLGLGLALFRAQRLRRS